MICKYFVVFFLVVVFCQHASLQKIKYKTEVMKVEYAAPWDRGPNTCAWLSQPSVDEKVYTYCVPWKQEYCGSQAQFLYDCCPGFIKSKEFGDQCVEEESAWRIIGEHLKYYGHNKFADYLAELNNVVDIANEVSLDTFTVLAPFDKEGDYSKHTGAANAHPLLASVIKGRVYASSLRNGMTLTSMLPTYPLKVTRYSNGIICVECNIFIEPDHEAQNGLIHFVSDRIIPNEKSIFQTLSEAGSDTTSFAADLPPNIKTLLDSTCSKWYTVFAPNNELWTSVKAQYPKELIGAIAANHVLSNMYCKASLIKANLKLGPTEAGEYLTVSCGADGSRNIETYCGIQTNIEQSTKEIMALNGVIYVIKDVALIPSQALDFATVMKNTQCLGINEEWARYISECNLNIEPGKNYAVLLPTSKAFTWWAGYKKFSKFLAQFKRDAAFRCKLIKYHIFEMELTKMTRLSYMWQQQSGYQTNNENVEWYEVDYFLKRAFGSELNFHYSPVDKFESIPFRNGAMYRINRVNMIPEKLIYDILKSRKDLSDSYAKVTLANMQNVVFAAKRPLNLFLAIKNGPWKASLEGKGSEETLMWLKLHWVQLYLWGDDIGYFDINTRHRFMSGIGLELIFDRRADGAMYIGYEGLASNQWAKVVEINIFGIDGMIWIIDRLLPCPDPYCKAAEIKLKEVYKILVFSCWDVFQQTEGVKVKALYAGIEKWLYLMGKEDECYASMEASADTKTISSETIEE